MRPMLATKGTHVPSGAEWSHEVKWDGVRILADAGADPGADPAGRVRMTSRNDNDVTAAWPELCESPLGGRDLLVDGEVIALNERGVPDFRVLQDRMHTRNATTARRLSQQVPATFMIFDLLRLDGSDLTDLPLEKRREVLSGLDLAGSTWQVPASYDDGAMLFDATLQQGLEGIVSKRLSSRYVFGQRTPHWLKFAHRHRLSYVVGGWRPQEGTTSRLGAVLVGQPTATGLMYRGRVGSGIGGKVSAALSDLLAPLERADSPFADDVPRIDTLGTHWVEPRVVIDVDTHGVGYTRLRQPSFQGVRHDLVAEDL
ncbi:MAG: non-homologous end-joining DNA ligase [Nocardioides sp.]